MTPSSHLLDRIRGEYREMPGLRLTLAQAQRLWQVEAGECESALHALVQEGFLPVTIDDAFVALPVTTRFRVKPLKAAFEPARIRRRA
jgi:hypothetical protein